jgi:hypothetical protein
VSLRRAELLQKALFIGLFLSCLPVWALNEAIIESILPVGPPLIKDERITFSVDLQFKKVPQYYWVYHNPASGKLYIQFFNIKLSAGTLSIHGIDILSAPVISSTETEFALTGTSAQIAFIFKEGWHCEAVSVSSTILRLQLWKYLEVPSGLKPGRRNFGISMIVGVFTAGCAALAYLILSNIKK